MNGAYLKSLFFIFNLAFFTLIEKTNPFKNHHGSSFLVNILFSAVTFVATSGLYALFLKGNSNNEFSMDSFVYTLVVVLSLDLTSYFWHWISHRIDILWRLHQCHHSDLYLSSTSAFRFHFAETIIGVSIKLLVIRLFDFSLFSVLIFELLFLFSNVFEHANIKLNATFNNILSYVFVTPSTHRLHHDVVYAHQNSNFSTIFIFWDKLFGTFKSNQSDDVVDFGIHKITMPLSVFELVVLPFKKQ